MFSSESLNRVFNSLAKFTGMLTGKEIQFQQVEHMEAMTTACEKMNKFFDELAETLNNPAIKMLGVLEPGKIYCLQVDMNGISMDTYCELAEELAKEGIRIAVIDHNANFVSIPKGYEVIQK